MLYIGIDWLDNIQLFKMARVPILYNVTASSGIYLRCVLVICVCPDDFYNFVELIEPHTSPTYCSSTHIILSH